MTDLSNFERVPAANLRAGDYIMRIGKLVEYGGGWLRHVEPDTLMYRLCPGVDPETIRVSGGPERHLGVAEVARELGVTADTVTKWIKRYPPQVGLRPFPTPDVAVGAVLGWRPVRVSEIREWRAGMPGRGAGGGRPPKRQPE